MSKLTYDCPLRWPPSREATPRLQQQRNQDFSTDLKLDEVLQYLEEEVDALTPLQAVLTTDTENLRIERLRKKGGIHTGAALHMKFGTQPLIVTCDRWQTLEHNIYAIHLVLRQCRNIAKWGVLPLEKILQMFADNTNAANHAYHGSTQELTNEVPDWMREFGLGATASLEDVTAIYHRRAKRCEGDNDTMVRLNQLMEQARKALEK